MAEKCTNTSDPPPSTVMKPKPFSALNHLTVPCAMSLSFIKVYRPRALRALLGRFRYSGAFCRSWRAARVRSTYTKTQQMIHGMAPTHRTSARPKMRLTGDVTNEPNGRCKAAPTCDFTIDKALLSG